jgi:hypothetical protein
MKRLLIFVVLFAITLGAAAQAQKMYLWKNGTYVEFLLSEVDSITFSQSYLVDLGLPSGTLWADRNVGADSPEDHGDYFAWGETGPKASYSWENYKLSNGSYDVLTKYCTSETYGYDKLVDEKTSLEAVDDAATANWGSQWSIPTNGQFEELINCCSWEWITLDGVSGYEVTGPNGNSIFLPAAGYRDHENQYRVGTYGYYWTSSLYEPLPDGAQMIIFASSTRKISYFERSSGFSVRAVVDFSIPEEMVSFTTGEPSEVTKNSMTASFSIDTYLTINGTIVTEQGVCYSAENEEPTIADNVVKCGTFNKGTWQCTLTGLLSGQKYYYRPYLKAANAVLYGPVISFMSLSDEVDYSEYAVDLGLPSGTLWADRNVGADSPKDYGDYFAWGETEPKSTYDWNNYKWCGGSYATISKYCTDSSLGYDGFTDHNTTLEFVDDAATINWGEEWCMPTYAQYEELISVCTWRWYGDGYEVVGPNGNSIFFPSAGTYDGGTLNTTVAVGRYWSNSLNKDIPWSAYYVLIHSEGQGLNYSRRHIGFSVRAVVK